MLAVAERPGEDPFVARCLTGASAAESLAPCERDIQLGDDLSLTYRFPARTARRLAGAGRGDPAEGGRDAEDGS